MHLRFFILTLTKAYFKAREQILPFVNNVENRVGSRNFIHQIIANTEATLLVSLLLRRQRYVQEP